MNALLDKATIRSIEVFADRGLGWEDIAEKLRFKGAAKRAILKREYFSYVNGALPELRSNLRH